MSVFMLVCPCCQSVYPLEAALNDVAAREAVAEAFKLTPLGDLLLIYVGLFKPPKRALAMTRAAKILKELLPMIREAKIERKGRIWSAPQDYWRAALTETLDRRDTLTLPLTGHGYLLSIIAGYSSKAEAKQEALIEARRAGHTAVGGVQLPPAPQFKGATPRSKMPDELNKYLHRAVINQGEKHEH